MCKIVFIYLSFFFEHKQPRNLFTFVLRVIMFETSGCSLQLLLNCNVESEKYKFVSIYIKINLSFFIYKMQKCECNFRTLNVYNSSQNMLISINEPGSGIRLIFG